MSLGGRVSLNQHKSPNSFLKFLASHGHDLLMNAYFRWILHVFHFPFLRVHGKAGKNHSRRRHIHTHLNTIFLTFQSKINFKLKLVLHPRGWLTIKVNFFVTGNHENAQLSKREAHEAKERRGETTHSENSHRLEQSRAEQSRTNLRFEWY